VVSCEFLIKIPDQRNGNHQPAVYRHISKVIKANACNVEFRVTHK